MAQHRVSTRRRHCVSNVVVLVNIIIAAEVEVELVVAIIYIMHGEDVKKQETLIYD